MCIPSQGKLQFGKIWRLLPLLLSLSTKWKPALWAFSQFWHIPLNSWDQLLIFPFGIVIHDFIAGQLTQDSSAFQSCNILAQVFGICSRTICDESQTLFRVKHSCYFHYDDRSQIFQGVIAPKRNNLAFNNSIQKQQLWCFCFSFQFQCKNKMFSICGWHKSKGFFFFLCL